MNDEEIRKLWSVERLYDADLKMVGSIEIAWANVETLVEIVMRYLASLLETSGDPGYLPREFSRRLSEWTRLARESHTPEEFDRVQSWISATANLSNQRGEIVHSFLRPHAESRKRLFRATPKHKPSTHVRYYKDPKGRVAKIAKRAVNTAEGTYRFYKEFAERRGHDFDARVREITG